MKYIDYSTKDGIVIIRLNRPDRLNALGPQLREELRNILQTFEKDEEAKVAILTGTGRAFSAGDDVKEMQGEGGALSGAWKQTSLGDMWGFQQVNKPIIAAVNGLAYGGGLLLTLECDIRIAAESATFCIAEINLGLSGLHPKLLLQGIPICIVSELALTGLPITAKRAWEVGIINTVVPDNELLKTAQKFAERMAQLSPLAMKLTKKTIRSETIPSEQMVLNTEMVIQVVAQSEDAKEGVKAFTEKRKPLYKGR